LEVGEKRVDQLENTKNETAISQGITKETSTGLDLDLFSFLGFFFVVLLEEAAPARPCRRPGLRRVP
jgi:hypothetical protein